ncbi:MAG: hypothetical protein ACQKBU_04555 [Verrucomicrobiales bacterium]
MNRRRSEEQPNYSAAFLAVALAAIVATTGGAMHAIFRNGQIKTERQIVDARKRIEEHRLDIQMIEVRTEHLLDRYEIRDQLALIESPLIAVDHGVVENVTPPRPVEPFPVAARP